VPLTPGGGSPGPIQGLILDRPTDPIRSQHARRADVAYGARLGEAQAVAPAEAGYRPTDPQTAFHLARFVEEVRSIPADPVVVRQNWLRAYDFTTDKGALFLNDYARANDPFTQVGKVQVAVDVSSVIRASPDSFRVAWTERRYQDGSLAATERWSAILTVVFQPPRTPDALRKNPLGLFVNPPAR
jgi:type IV secretion system protein VirB5